MMFNEEIKVVSIDSTFEIPYTYEIYMDTSFLKQRDATDFETISAFLFSLEIRKWIQ